MAWVYKDKIPIYPKFYLLKADSRLMSQEVLVASQSCFDSLGFRIRDFGLRVSDVGLSARMLGCGHLFAGLGPHSG